MSADIACEKCGYEWEYTGELYRTTCPRCNKKTATGIDTASEASDSDGASPQPSSSPRLPEERQAAAFERIATALERIADSMEDYND